MSDAQKEILKMLADNVITVEEAERLIKALDEGERKKQDSTRTLSQQHIIISLFTGQHTTKPILSYSLS